MMVNRTNIDPIYNDENSNYGMIDAPRKSKRPANLRHL